MDVVCLHEQEAVGLMHEIFELDSYFQEGITLKPGAVVIDAGANIGLFALRASMISKVIIYAFEPLPVMHDAFKANTSTCEAVRLLPCALGDKNSTSVPFTYFPGAPAESTRIPEERAAVFAACSAALSASRASGDRAALLVHAPREEPPPVVFDCKMMRLSTAIEMLDLDRVDLLKIDVEGDELNVLRGVDACHWPMVQQVVMEVHDVAGRLGSVVRLLRHQGFVHIVARRQSSTVSAGYAAFIPDELAMYFVYARRESPAVRPDSPA